MILRSKKNAMGVSGQHILRFIDVLSANSFFTTLLPNCLEKNTFVTHTLTLLSEAPRAKGCFRCNACQRLCNGFNYNCDKCGYTLNVKCSLISDTITHDGHEHQLIFASPPSQNCSACDDFKAITFCCADYEFTLDFKCATLPHNICRII